MEVRENEMKLADWITLRVVATTGGTRSAVYVELSKESGVSTQTIANVDRGMRLKTYDRAKALSDATDGAVTVAELCE